MISREICQRVLQKAVSTGADYAEIFAENTVNHVINMIADKVDSINDAVIAGAAVRVYKGLRSVMASTVDMTPALCRVRRRGAGTGRSPDRHCPAGAPVWGYSPGKNCPFLCAQSGKGCHPEGGLLCRQRI